VSDVNVSYLAIGPEVLLTLGAVVVLMVDVFRKPSPRVHAWLAALTLVLAGGVAGLQWSSATTRPAMRSILRVMP